MTDLSEILRRYPEHQREIGNSFQLPINASRIYQKVEISPKGFTLGVKAENFKNLFNLPPRYY
jgi:hypothetical protein